ncbi:MAG: TonB-dependent receptor [Tenacibaculum sp.]|nr:TonB-dependent receptor [Tenacibaculum sp.]
MNRLKTFIYYIIIFYNCLAFSQTYTGKVVDSKKAPIAYADIVALKTDDNKLITGTITDENGNFELKLNTETPFYLEISFVGFETTKISSTKTNLGIITLKEETTKLDEVVVTTRKNLVQQKVDRLVFNVENSVASNGGSALDLLKQTPSVQVDDKQVNIVGKQSVRILVNDRIIQLSGEELIAYLSSFSSDEIKNIEVITTPPSKYDAEGNGGLINIVLKKAKENSWSNQIRTSYIQTTYPAIKFGNTFNYSHKKWDILASLDTKKGHEQQLTKIDIYYPNGVWKNTIISKNTEDYLSAKFGVDYKLTPKASIGFLYSGNYRTPDEKEHSINYIFNQKNNVIGKIKNNAVTNNKNNYNSLNIHYLQKLDTLGRKMSVDLDYFNYQINKDRIFGSYRSGNVTSSLVSNNTGNQNIKNYSAKIDFEHPTKFANFSYGAKIAQTKTDNEVKFFDLTSGNYILDKTKSNAFKYTENIQALYFDATKNFNKKWQGKIGLRVENTITKGFSRELNKTKNREYLQFFPSVFLNYVSNKNNIWNISYNRRINRPSFGALNPFRYYISANSFVEGNPNLQPNFSNNFQLKYIFKSKFITELFYNFTEDIYTQTPQIDVANNTQYYTFKNIGTSYRYGITQTIIFNPFKWWNTTNVFSLINTNSKLYKNINLGITPYNGWVSQLYTNQIFLLNQKGTLQAEATFGMSSKGYWLLYEINPTYYLNLGLKMQFLNKKLQVTAKVNDVFKSSNPDVITHTNGVKQIYNNYYDNHYFTLGVSYKFGNNKIRVKERRLGNKEELNRAN